MNSNQWFFNMYLEQTFIEQKLCLSINSFEYKNEIPNCFVNFFYNINLLIYNYIWLSTFFKVKNYLFFKCINLFSD